MKPATTGTVSGCIIWFIVFGLISTCLLPVGMMIGGFTSVTNFAMRTLEPLICPDGATAKSRSYATTTTDNFGNSQPSTAYVMQSVDSNGAVVKGRPCCLCVHLDRRHRRDRINSGWHTRIRVRCTRWYDDRTVLESQQEARPGHQHRTKII